MEIFYRFGIIYPSVVLTCIAVLTVKNTSVSQTYRMRHMTCPLIQ